MSTASLIAGREVARKPYQHSEETTGKKDSSPSAFSDLCPQSREISEKPVAPLVARTLLPDLAGLVYAMDGGDEEMAAAILIVGVLLVLGLLVKTLDLKRKREFEAVAVQSQIADALLREPALLGVVVTPTAHLPLWSGSPVTVDVTGQVPSEDVQHAALRVIEREALRTRPDVRIESSLHVARPMARRVA